MAQQACGYRFGPFELRTRAREISKQGVKLKLRPQPFQVLELLLEHAGDVVTREELHSRVWGTETFVDFEHGLNTAVKELRGVLADSATEPKYIQTLPRVGYRLVVPVEAFGIETAATASPAPELTVPEKSKAIDAPASPVAASRLRARLWVPLALAALLVLAFLGYRQWPRARKDAPPQTTRVMLAVLPFDNLTADPAQDYFSDGLTEEMIAQLGRLDPEHLGVIARTSVVKYKHNENQLEEIASKLSVQYVLEGSVRREGTQVRVTTKLIQVHDQSGVWAKEYDRELVNLLQLQAEIAADVSKEIQQTLGGMMRDVRLPTASPASALSAATIAAHDAYLKGLYFWNKRDVPDFEQAITYFQEAIAADPQYAPAYAGLANTYSLLAGYSGSNGDRYMSKAKAAALRALQLDASLPEAHTAWALAVQNYDYDWDTSEREFHRAIELNPNYATAHHWYAEHLMWVGKFDQALQESERARQLDPLSLIIAADRGAIFYFSRQYPRAIEQFQSVRELEPHFQKAGMIIFCFIEAGEYDQARANLRARKPEENQTPWYPAAVAYLEGHAGNAELARKAFRHAQQLYRLETMDPSVLIPAALGAGDKQEALTLLERAYVQHCNVMTSLKVNPILDPLRAEPRFQELLRRVKLAP
jgi:TolB-like protein/DNA-binding winged helix-turn-helix (wHTH) protein